MAAVKPEKRAFRWSKPAAKGLIGLVLSQRIGTAFDQEIDLFRRQHEPRRNRVEEAPRADPSCSKFTRSMKKLMSPQRQFAPTPRRTRSAADRPHRQRLTLPTHSLASVENAA